MNNTLLHNMNRTHTHIDVEKGELISLPKDGTDYPPVNADINNLITYGKTTGGEGTPDNPIPLINVSEFDITSCGENLFDWQASTEIVRNHSFFEKVNGKYTFKGERTGASDMPAASNGTLALSINKLLPLGQYYYRYKYKIIEKGVNDLRITNYINHSGSLVVTQNQTAIDVNEERVFSGTFTKTAWPDVRFLFYVNTHKVEIYDIEIGFGSTIPESYTPYRGSTTTIALKDTEGNPHSPKSLPDGTRDEVNLDGGESVERVKRLVITSGTSPLSWNYFSDSETICRAIARDETNKWGITTGATNNAKCSIAKVETAFYIPNSAIIDKRANDTQLNLVFLKSDIINAGYLLDATGIRAYIDKIISDKGGQPIIFDYPLAEPKPWTLHPDEQKPKLIQYHTNIFNDAGLEMQCEVRKLGNRAMILANLKTSSGKVLMTESGKIIQVKI